MKNLNKIKLLNIEINNIKLNDLLTNLHEGFIVTPNIDHLIKLQKDKTFYNIYNLADYVLCDSRILQFASFFLKTPISEKISGSDLFPAFYHYHKKNKKIKIFLLGASEGVANKAKNNINKKTNSNIIVGSHSPSFGFENDKLECEYIISLINQSKANVLAVGVGAPKQEKWIALHKDKMPNIKIFMAIGATIDFEAGNIKRAPKIMSKIGLEWLYRFFCEPKRLWKRYFVDDLPFFWLILKQKLGFYKDPFNIFYNNDN